jgi:D-amino peptidase
MKVFITADIEGIALDTTFWEDLLPKPIEKYAKQMTAEVVAACEGAFLAGASEIVVKDGHNNGHHNIDVYQLPPKVKLHNGMSGHPYGQVEGIDSSFDAALFIGQHAAATRNTNALSHTSVRRLYYVKINDRIASEFMIASWSAALENVPTVFVSGDKGLCEDDADLHPNLITCPVKEGIGATTLCYNPQEAVQAIKAGVEKALKQSNIQELPKFPETFKLEVCYKDPINAYKYSFYPGIEMIDNNTLVYKTDDYFELIRAYSFMK